MGWTHANPGAPMSVTAKLADLETPALLLDCRQLQVNLQLMKDRARDLGVTLRPHAKTAKSIPILELAVDASCRITVSTLKEAEAAFAAGFSDILYAVGIAPNKLRRVLDLRRAGCDLCVVLDNVEAARAVSRAAREAELALPVMIEIDTDGHRAGIKPEAEDLIAVASALEAPAVLKGVMTHAGESYGCDAPAALQAIAELERAGAVRAAERLRAAGHACPEVSVGSTPTALSAVSLEGVTELRAGVYMFFDLVMAGIGVCATDQIALSVLTTVIGHQAGAGRLIVDAGWMAMSRDRGTAKQKQDQGYGLVQGHEDLIILDANQEHGLVGRRDGAALDLSAWPIGSLLRILPNHACATAAQYGHYDLIGLEQGPATWPRFSGW